MDENTVSFPQRLPVSLPAAVPGGLCGVAVWVAHHGFGDAMLKLAAGLGAAAPAGAGGAGRLRIIDGGNCLRPYALARALYRVGCRNVEAALARIQVQRGFTFYQVGALLEQAQAGEGPLLVLDLLGSFMDEAVAAGERRQTLEGCTANLRRLGAQGLVVASVRAGSSRQPDPIASDFLELILETADGVWEEDIPQPGPPRALELGI